MIFLKFFFGSIGSLLDRIVCVLFAIVLAQAPVYIAQYIDVLSGAEMESQKTFDDIEGRAAKYGMTADQFLDDLLDNSNPMVVENAEATSTTINRYYRYRDALTAILNSSVWTKPFRLAQHYDPSVHAAMQFEPNVPLTFEGGFYALAGVLIAMLIIGFFRFLFNKIFKANKTEASEKARPETKV